MLLARIDETCLLTQLKKINVVNDVLIFLRRLLLQVASGLPKKNGDKHAKEICAMALNLKVEIMSYFYVLKTTCFQASKTLLGCLWNGDKTGQETQYHRDPGWHPHWFHCGWNCGNKDAQILSLRRHH